MRKYMLAVACVLIALCLLTACQPTPEVPVVVGKDQEKMLEQAQSTPETEESVPLAEQVEAPETYSAQEEWSDGKLVISAEDAPVIVPDADSIPTLRVEAADFTQEQVSGFFAALFDGQTVYDVEYGAQTKDDISEQIVRLRQLKGTEEYSWEGDQAQLDDEIARLEKQYETAPETKEDVIVESDGMLKQMELMDQDGNHMAYYMGLRVSPDPKVNMNTMFNVQNNNDMTEGVWEVSASGTGFGGMSLRRSAYISYLDLSLGYNYGQHTPITVDEDSVIDDAAVLEKLKMTPAQAKAFGEGLLEKAGADYMTLCGMYLEDDENLGNTDDIVAPAEHYAYHLYFRRTIGGIPCSFLQGSSSAGGDMDDIFKEIDENGISADFSNLKYYGEWSYEMMEMRINDDGVVEFDWFSPLTITDTLVEKSALIPFSQAAQAFERRLRDTYEPQVKDNEYIMNMTFNVTRVALELQRVAEQDSIENGLLVPAWSFYGTTVTRHKEKMLDGEESIVESKNGFDRPEILLTVNAIDGSVINLGRGY